jgi:hypothetical protein
MAILKLNILCQDQATGHTLTARMLIRFIVVDGTHSDEHVYEMPLLLATFITAHVAILSVSGHTEFPVVSGIVGLCRRIWASGVLSIAINAW